MSNTFCPHCEIDRQTANISFADIEQKGLALAQKTDSAVEDAVYKSRMQICSTCEAYSHGYICLYCGSYASFRAYNCHLSCPYPNNDKWSEVIKKQI